MSHTFEIGEIAVFCAHKFTPVRLGQEVEIIGALKVRRTWWPVPGENEHRPLCYKVRFPDGLSSNLEPWQLRKRRPPQDWVKLCNLHDIPREVVHG